jgi:hypothetical protein
MFGGKNPWFHGKNYGFLMFPLDFPNFSWELVRNRSSQPWNAWNFGAGAGTTGAAGQAAASASSGGRGREVPWVLGWVNPCQIASPNQNGQNDIYLSIYLPIYLI